MKLYNRQLKSLADLKREQYLLRYAVKQNSTDDLLAFGERGGKRKKKSKHANDDDDHLGGLASHPLLKNALGLLGGGGAAGTILGNKHVRRAVMKRIPRKRIAGLAWEVFGGYLKWKAIELSYGLIRDAVRKRREKKFEKELVRHPVRAIRRA